jgi:hypothetical protein
MGCPLEVTGKMDPKLGYGCAFGNYGAADSEGMRWLGCGAEGHDEIFIEVEGHHPFYRPLGNLIKVCLDGILVDGMGRRVDG